METETVEIDRQTDWICPFCGTTVQDGFTICTGCRSEVVYGLTRAEWQNLRMVGASLGALIGLLPFLLLPRHFLIELQKAIEAVSPGLWFTAAMSICYFLLLITIFSRLLPQIRDQRQRRRNPRFFRRS